MKRIKVFVLVLLLSIFIGSQAQGETLEDRLVAELSAMKGVKLAQISFTLDGHGDITGADVNVRVNTAYEMGEVEKNAIINFVVFSTSKLTPENVALNISEEPVISFGTGSYPYEPFMIEDDIEAAILNTLPVEEVYVNLVKSRTNILGEFEVMSKAAVLIKLPQDYLYDVKEVFSIVDFLTDSVKDLPMDNILIIDNEGNSLFEIVQ